MIQELLESSNIEQALEEQIAKLSPNRGFYIFLEPREYALTELSDSFFANNVSFVSKKSEPNPLLEEKIKQLNIYGFAINGNKQIFSTQGLNTIYSQMYTIKSIENFLTSDKEVRTATHFFEDGFTREYVESRLKKNFTLHMLSGTKEQRVLKQNELVQNVLKSNETTIENMSIRAKTTLATIKINKEFIEKIAEHFSKIYPSEMKTIRLTIVVSKNQTLDYLKDESYLYFYDNLLANKGIFFQNEAYFYSAISSNYNVGKPMMYLNRSDAPTVGNELIRESNLVDQVSLFLFIRAIAQRTNKPIKTFYLQDKKISDTPQIGALRYKVLDEKKSYYILDYSPLSEWNKKGTRPFEFSCELAMGNGYTTKKLTITTYEQLANIIFFGSKEKQVGNQLYVDKTEKDNSTIKNKYFEGNKLSPDYDQLYNTIKNVGTFDESENRLVSPFLTIRKDVLLNSRYELVSVTQAIKNYRNLLSFWDTLTHKKHELEERTIYLNQIQTDEEYLIAIVRLHLELFYKVNHFSNKNEDRFIFNGKEIDKLLKTTRYSVLMKQLNQYKKQYQYIFNELNKEELAKKQEEIDLKQIEEHIERAPSRKNKYQNRIFKTKTQNELLSDHDILSVMLNYLSEYQPTAMVIPNREDSIYALIHPNIHLTIKK